ncbi:MAG: glycine cleavage system aminomethyltransferase GcvT [Bacteroidales bacterium]|jgi:aminomethyltransferase|nr:glycine cleavage system aminomethyltransferase GcvT [Bacteroidales bacterium]MDD3331468.1 glycine cleavage system aminomethyltransferase GcvT [Bacteroidales bacterium]MDD3692035.1 glycine cleavage system aminomethyltransferase GcvT [Bacteroidales bacterium]MDD4045354.1 glycine cleavage system aminomethyltransferase GcvT [Bacteroidales bacterium]MDD4582399.1 glycine cleavage system aminomethyltransferase GcvT [Bacteroidales bacterium]
MKYTVYAKKHEEIGGKMVEFAGFYMPVQYEGLVIEHQHVRKAVGVFDVSHMGEIYVKGPKALEFVQWVSSNDASVLSDGKVQYCCFPNETGGIVDDFLTYRIKEDHYLLVVNASNIDKDWNWLVKQNKNFGAELYNASDETSQLAIQGPLAMKVMQKLTDEPIMDMEYYTFKYLSLAGIPNVLLSTTGYTGSGGCEIYFKNEDAFKIWDAVFEAGKEFDIKPIGLGARDTLRLEMGFCLYGHEINDSVSPLEGGLGWITKFVDHKNFINKAALLKQKQEGVSRKVVGLEMIDRGIPRQGYEVVDEQGNLIGHICSGTQGPSVQKAIGTALVNSAFSKINTEIFVKIRDKALKAVVVKMPFYKA